MFLTCNFCKVELKKSYVSNNHQLYAIDTVFPLRDRSLFLPEGELPAKHLTKTHDPLCQN